MSSQVEAGPPRERHGSELEVAAHHAGPSLKINTVSSEDNPKEWESRGTVLSIVIGVLATCGSHVVYLTAMFALMKTSDSKLLRCSTAKYPTMGYYGLFACNWTKAYLECFPELALTICLLIVGRNLLQQRLYYSFLMRGAVLQYKSKNMFMDGMLRIFLWCYANAMLHLVLLMWLIHQGGGDEMFADELEESKGGTKTDFFLHASQRAVHRHDVLGNDDSLSDLGLSAPVHPLHDPALKHQIQLLVELIGFFVIPATLFLIYLFTGYDIEGTLVPLSQYFYDARKAQSLQDNLWTPSATCDLAVIDDDATKLLIEKHQDHIHDAAGSVTEALDEILDIYTREGQHFEETAIQTGQTFNGIARAHWPCRLLISEDATDLSHRSFRAVWMTFITISLTGQLFMMVSLSRLVLRDSDRYEEGGFVLVHLAVVLFNMGVEVYGITVNAATVVQWFQHDMLRNRGDSTRDCVAIERQKAAGGDQAKSEGVEAKGFHVSGLSATGVVGTLHAAEQGAVEGVKAATAVKA